MVVVVVLVMMVMRMMMRLMLEEAGHHHRPSEDQSFNTGIYIATTDSTPSLLDVIAIIPLTLPLGAISN